MSSQKRLQTATATSPNGVLDIDSDGDLILEAGTDPKAVLMRVSEDTITRMSKVFKVMLGPNFAEGQKTHTVTDPLKLRDDDPVAMELMMKMAHHEVDTASDIKPRNIVALVLLCEKLADALCVAFITDDGDNFGDISHSIFQVATDTDFVSKQAFSPALLQIMPYDFQGKYTSTEFSAFH